MQVRQNNTTGWWLTALVAWVALAALPLSISGDVSNQQPYHNQSNQPPALTVSLTRRPSFILVKAS